ncbi:MAG TPA: acetyl-CoA carboxylase, carboxyltransferase subunit beta [Chloroflexota bacterium]|nr:acetyl-CoA carboxylase, carboxyltransferase subunit beta [Chloroflexota bacterium]
MKDLFRHMPGGGPGGLFRGRQVPTDMWQRCDRCHELTYTREWESNFKVCPRCGYHAPLSTDERVAQLVDEGSFEPLDEEMRSSDPLHFAPEGRESYTAKLERETERSKMVEACTYGRGALDSIPVVLAVLDMRFFVGTMGAVVGEKIARACELAIRERRPLITVSASGGARQQEGVIALLQMAKTAAAVRRVGAARLPYVSILTDPTFGGVTASYATLGDCIIAEPGAVIGFAGRHIIEQATGEKVPPDTGTAEFQLRHGMVDLVVPRREMRDVVGRILRLHMDAVGAARPQAHSAELIAAG